MEVPARANVVAEWVTRLWGHIAPAAVPSACLEWQKSLDCYGYGQIKVAGRKQKAHVMAWISVHGDNRNGMSLLHSCDNRKCCNVDHLRLGTPTQNHQEMVTRGRAWYQKRSKPCFS